MDKLRHSPGQPEAERDEVIGRIPKPFPLVRYYLIASVLLVVGAFAIINFSTQRIQNDTVITRLRSEAERDIARVMFDISVAITSYYHPGDDLATVFAANKQAFDRDVINALSGEPIPRIDLLSPAGELVYSTDPNATSALTVTDAIDVYAGQSMSRYMPKYSLTLFNGRSSEVATVITANPVNTEWSVESGPVAVLVGFKDVTETVPASTVFIAPERIAVVAGTMATLFVLLSWVVVRGHRFTTTAREQLASLLDTEREVRSQLDVRNAELEEANMAKSQFLSMVSHELKTPLTAIISFTRSLNKSIAPTLDERQARQFDALHRNGKNLKLLIDELLDVSAASSGKLRLTFDHVTVDVIVSDAVQSVQEMFEKRGQALSVSMPDPQLEFTGDHGRLQQVLVNLLSNASKYSPKNSGVTLDVFSSEKIITFQVTDSGIGISADDQKRLFSTFFRTEDAIASGAPGTGLGLVIVRSIVEGHGGDVNVESQPGVGTTISVSLPLTASIPNAMQVFEDDQSDVAA